MLNLEEYYSFAAKEYESLTVSLSAEVGSIIYSVRCLENNFLTMGNSLSKLSEDVYTETADRIDPLLKQEIKDLIQALNELKQTVKFNLNIVIKRINNSLALAAKDSSLGLFTNEVSHKAIVDFRKTLSKCIKVLEQLDDDLFNAEISLVYTR